MKLHRIVYLIPDEQAITVADAENSDILIDCERVANALAGKTLVGLMSSEVVRLETGKDFGELVIHIRVEE